MRLLSLICLLLMCINAIGQKAFVDNRDGNRYELFQLGKHLWFKTNLKFKTPTSWCYEKPDSPACDAGNFYFPTDLISICPDGWRVPSWRDYRKAIEQIGAFYDLADSIKYMRSTLPLYKDLHLDGELVTGLTLLGDTSFFDLATTGWVEGDAWHPQNETTMWIVHDISNTPQPHVHVRDHEIIMHSHGHNVIDKPKKLRRFAVRCISDVH